MNFAVVVSGIPRSGTSLMMQCLRAGGVPLLVDDERPPDDDNPRGYLEYAPVTASVRDASWLLDAKGRAVKVVSALLPELPAGPALRVLLMRRDLGEVLASQRAMLERSHEAADPSFDAQLASAFEEQQEQALRWARARPKTELLPVAHRQLIEDPPRALEEVAAFLGEALPIDAMARQVDPALWRKR